jgi:hypothetical protein
MSCISIRCRSYSGGNLNVYRTFSKHINLSVCLRADVRLLNTIFMGEDVIRWQNLCPIPFVNLRNKIIKQNKNTNDVMYKYKMPFILGRKSKCLHSGLREKLEDIKGGNRQ